MFHGIPEKIFPDMDHADKIFTHMTREEKHKLYELALHSPGKVFVEIGSYLGASSCYIAEAIQSDTSKKLYCVDTWDNEGMTEGARDTFDEFCSNTSSYVDTIVSLRGKSLEVAQTFHLGIDYLFVDADHSYEAVKADMVAWLPKLNSDAIVICHDTGWAEGVQKAADELIMPISITHKTLPNMYWANIRSGQKTKPIKAPDPQIGDCNVSEIYNKKFYDAHKDENFLSAKQIVPLIIKNFECSSVVDVGCGLGAWLSVFKQCGIDEIWGVDANKLAETNYLIDKTKIKTGCDFSSPSFNLNTKADLTICLEVAEHLPESAADMFVEKLICSAPVIIFSAAYPEQTGVNHINEQPPWYWREKFNKHGYVEIDFLRPLIWKNEKISWWYRQNITSFVKNDYLKQNPPIFDLFKQYGQRNSPHRLTVVNEWILKKWLQTKSMPTSNKGSHSTSSANGVERAANELSAPDTNHVEFTPDMFSSNIELLQKTIATNAPAINLSVIIPTRDRSKLLSRVLGSLMAQTYPEHLFEVIVVDNNSSDDTREVCRKYEETIKNFQYVYVTEPGLHVARHTGWQRSCGEILIYGDDDIRASSTWLEGIAQCFKDPDVALAGGNILPEFEADPPEWVDRLWNKTPWGKVLGQYSLIDFGNHDSEISPMYVWGANFAIKKTVLSEAGGFHPDGMPSKLSRFRGDGETHVSEFIQQHKYKTVHHSRATVFHWISKERMTVEYLYKRMFLQGISDSFTYIRSNKATGKLKQYKNKPDRIEDALYKGHCNGYNYHHIEVKKDPELLKWVLQSTYVADNMIQEDCIYEEDIKQVNNAKKHIQSKDYRAALQVLDQIGHISPHIKNLQYLRTLCLLNLGRNTEANEAALLELKFFPENSDCINLMNLFSSNDEKNILNANKIKQGAI